MVAIKMNLEQKRTASDAEVRKAFAGLSNADYTRINLIARSRAAGLGSFEPLDLYHEAVERILAGRRPWPLDLDFIVFLAETMRSVASEVRKRHVRGPITTEADLGHCDPELAGIGDDAPGSERNLAARDGFERILRHFQNDTEVLQLIAGLAVGETAQETSERTGLSKTEFDAARKRFRRGLPEGLNPKGDTQ